MKERFYVGLVRQAFFGGKFVRDGQVHCVQANMLTSFVAGLVNIPRTPRFHCSSVISEGRCFSR